MAGAKAGWYARLKAGLGRSSAALGIGGLFKGRKLDEATLDEFLYLPGDASLGLTRRTLPAA